MQKYKNLFFFILSSLALILSIFILVKITHIEGLKWFYFSIICLIDHYFFHYINWTPWKKRKVREEKKKNKFREWAESIIFAIIAATLIHVFIIQPYVIPTSSLEGTLLRGDFLFVSKFHYGSNVPNTPLFLPFMHNKLPFTQNTPSYLDWIQLGYNRLPGFQKIKNNDLVVFNWPTDNLQENMPFDKKTNYVKRCTGIAGQTLEIKNGVLFIDGKKQLPPNRGNIQHSYWVHFKKENRLKNIKPIAKHTSINKIEKAWQNQYNVEIIGQAINPLKILDRSKPIIEENLGTSYIKDIIIHGTEENVNQILQGEKKNGYKSEISIKKINQNLIQDSAENFPFKWYSLKKYTDILTRKETSLFPYHLDHDWDHDNYGPIYIPKKGDEILLNDSTLALYKNLIENYESYTITSSDSIYKFKMDYYWMMGDNRHNSQDSRSWGFVPENHIVGKPIFLWLSINTSAKGIFNKVRWKRMFTTIHGEGDSRWYLPYFIIFCFLIYFRKRGYKLFTSFQK